MHLSGGHGPPQLIGEQTEAGEERTCQSLAKGGASMSDVKALSGKPELTALKAVPSPTSLCRPLAA